MKKTFIYSFCVLFVLVSVIASLIFILSGKITSTTTEKTDMSGTWIVAAVYDNDIPTFTKNQFIVFNDTDAVLYKDDLKTAYANSKYIIDDENQMTLSDISRVYKIAEKSENCIRLYENGSRYMLLIKNHSLDLVITPFTSDIFNGKWDISMKGDQYNSGEVLEFNGNSMSYYKNATAEPAVSTTFTLSGDGMLYAQDLNISMKCYVVSESTLVFVEENGIVWELVRTRK